MGENGNVSSNPDMLDVATSNYKNLFASELKPTIHLGVDFWDQCDLVTAEENENLEKNLF